MFLVGTKILRWPTILLASIIHMVWGVLLVLDPSAIHITSLSALSALPGTAPGGAPTTHAIGLVLIAFSLLGFWAISQNVPGRKTLAALLPQQCVLILAATAGMYAVVVGHYGDGVMRPHAFILADQAPIITLAVIHTIVLVMMHVVVPIAELYGKQLAEAKENRLITIEDRLSTEEQRNTDIEIIANIAKVRADSADIRADTADDRAGVAEQRISSVEHKTHESGEDHQSNATTLDTHMNDDHG